MERKIVIHRHGASQNQGGSGNIKDILKGEKFLQVHELFGLAKADVNLKVVTQGGLKFLQDNVLKDQSAIPRVMHDIGMKAHGPQEDRAYQSHPYIQRNVRRGNTVLET